MNERIEETVPAAFEGDRIDRFVAAVTGESRSTVKALIAEGRVTHNGRTVTSASTRVDFDDRIVAELRSSVDEGLAPDADVPFSVVHEDADVIVINKPAGVVVYPGAGQRTGTLVNGLLSRYPELAEIGERHRPGIVHRLDRGTSGVLMVARTHDAYDALVGQLAAHEPERVYEALVWGQPERDSGTIDAPIGRSTRHPTRMTVTPDGRPAVTHYSVLRRHNVPVTTALLECRLETGRTHQIRVHLRAIGHPIVGDRDYDGGRPGLDPGRPFLHACILRFAHPRSGVVVEVEAPLPPDLEDVLAGCR
jgi:23S rRNA pseudouridine1911/1915/1917 synthase